jgi:zinc protease
MIKSKTLLFLCGSLFGITLFLNQNSWAQKSQIKISFPVEKYKLENGLTVILQQDRTIPMISYHTWYRVGSRNEAPGVTGAAHMLEHMMFKGAKKYSGKAFDKILHENGITNNAFTSWDYTGFYQNLPSSKLELMMDMEVDRMRFLSLKEEDLVSELQVVGEERRWRVDNSPPSLLREALFEALYKAHPYRWPVIGFMNDIQAYTTAKLKHFYDTYYLPNNAVLVLAGDFEIEATKNLIEKYYGTLKAKPLPEIKIEQENFESFKAHKFVIESEVESSILALAYPGVASGTSDSWALDLLANIMGAGTSSRLYQNLVYNNQIASGTGSSNISNMDPGLFLITVQIKPGVKVDAVEKALSDEIEKVRNKKVTKKELEKSKNILLKELVDSLTTIDGKAQSLAVNEIFYGDYSRLFTDLDKYNQVSLDDIQRVSKKYLQSKYQLSGLLKPKSKNGK